MKKVLSAIYLVTALFVVPNSHTQGSSFFGDLMSQGIDGAAERKKIREWYKLNKNKLVIIDGSESLNCKKIKSNTRFDSYSCNFRAKLINNTDNQLNGLILKIKAYNKAQNNYIVTDEIVALDISIYPTVKKSINIKFPSYSIAEAQSQLGKNFTWNYDLVAYLPKHLYIDSKLRKYTKMRDGYGWLAE